ncbi:hypothetical protein D3C72_255900 [compost metagenome]
MPDRLGAIMNAATCRRALGAPAWQGVAVYMLWSRKDQIPVYCGTARSPSRLRSHLAKDDLANGPKGKTHVNPDLRAYCLAQPAGWLGVSFALFESDDEARAVERDIIGRLGIRRYGGQLFNQRLSG